MSDNDSNDNNPFIPEWMRQKREQRESANAREEARKNQARAARLLVGEKSPLFWQGILRELKISVDALPTLEMSGSINPVGLNAFRVFVNKLGYVANFVYTDLFLLPEPLRIHCNVFGEGSYDLRFCALSESEISVIDGSEPMNQEQTAEYIMRRMTSLIESR